MLKFPCTLCGSRNWPNEWTSCPLCRLEDDDETTDELDDSSDESNE
jgi:hypothetical protein